MSLKSQMLEILRSNETRRISFSFTGTVSGANISVDRTTFQRVADAVQNDTIGIVQGGGVPDGMAMYAARENVMKGHEANTFYFGRNDRSSRIFNALVVHESVHASFDLTRTTIPWLDNETTAFIAQGYYLRNSGLDRSRLITGSEPYLGMMLVDSIARGDGIDRFYLEQLHGRLESSEQYHGYIRGTFTGDG